jgi:GGDEF domain-containing protein
MAVIMPDTDAGATVVAQLILIASRKRIAHPSSPVGRVTVSIGIAAASGHNWITCQV